MPLLDSLRWRTLAFKKLRDLRNFISIFGFKPEATLYLVVFVDQEVGLAFCKGLSTFKDLKTFVSVNFFFGLDQDVGLQELV